MTDAPICSTTGAHDRGGDPRSATSGPLTGVVVKNEFPRNSETGFLMNLTSYVSTLIKENIKVMLDSLAINSNTIDYWAIHPGGKKIVDDFFDVIQIDTSKASESYDVLKNFGNMSSPTVLFVLKQVIEKNTSTKKGETIFSAAFGPGLSIETMQASYA